MSDKTTDGLSSSGGWVDRYLLRYGPATILGALVSAYWYSRRRDLGITFSLPLGNSELAAAFGAVGFLFAYVASAPILVFHFARTIYLTRSKCWIATVMRWGSPTITLASFVGLRFMVETPLALLAAAAIGAWGMTLLVAGASYFGRDHLYRFYRHLAWRRSREHTGFVESYRTLREHGNAFYVLLFEIFLASIVTTFLKMNLVHNAADVFVLFLVAIGLWVAPATIAWYVASHLEVDFVEQPGNRHKTNEL